MKTILTTALFAGAASCAMGGTLQYGQRYAGEGLSAVTVTVTTSTHHRLADDFVLASAASLTSVEFWGYSNAGPASLAGRTFDLSIWSDEGPGLGVDDAGLIHLETFAFASLAPTPAGPLGLARKMTATFAVPIALSADTTYWFSIGHDGGTAYSWVLQGPDSPDPFGTLPLDRDLGGDGTWEGPFNGLGPSAGLAFALYGDSGSIIPLPSAGAIAVLGLAWVGATRRRPLRT